MTASDPGRQAGLREDRRRRGGALEIVSGVNAGQQVVASGQNKLQSGATVKIDNSIDVTKLDTSKLASGQ